MALDVVKAFEAPMSDQTWVNKVVIGGLVNIIPIINFLAIGYGLTYFGERLAGKEHRLPEWQDWGTLFVIGLKAFLIMLIYMLGVIIVMTLSTFLGGFLGGILAFILFLVTMFFLPVALLWFVQSGFSIAAAFAFQEIYSAARSKMDEYIIVYAVIVGLFLILWALAHIPLLGWILAPFAFFYLSLGFYNLLTMVFAPEPTEEFQGSIDPAARG
jgi:hypothetical protein